MPCAICRQRKAKRHCPGVHGEICPLCCGTERENTVNCPLHCPYLVEGHRYEFERAKPHLRDQMPHPQYEITDGFMHHRQLFLADLSIRLLRQALELPGLQDSDVVAALDGLIRTRETLASGLYYESAPEAPVPHALFRALHDGIEGFRKEESQMKGWAPLKDAEIILALVFLARLAHARNNGRPHCKSFLDFLREQFPFVAAQKTPGGLVLPG